MTSSRDYLICNSAIDDDCDGDSRVSGNGTLKYGGPPPAQKVELIAGNAGAVIGAGHSRRQQRGAQEVSTVCSEPGGLLAYSAY
jgi:hypothetical protein